MDLLKTEVLELGKKMENIRKYGQSGGPDGRGILTDIKADELPDESLQEFSNAPYEFEESALLVKEDVQRLYYHAGTANRFSENYLKYCTELERYIRQAGSLCLTKAVLEQKGFEFPKLADFSTLELIRMVSFHIRKCHAAINGLYQDNNKLGFVYFQWELRWINLGERLKATEVKIQKIRDGKINADDLLERENAFPERSRTNEGKNTGLSKNVLPNPKALPLERSMASDMLHREKILEKQTRDFQHAEDRAMRALGLKPFPPYPVPNCEYEPQPAPEVQQELEKLPKGQISEGEDRQILMEEAMKQGDQESLMSIPMEDSDAFYARWTRYIDKLKTKRINDIASRDVPSDNTRKRLREKRKKKR